MIEEALKIMRRKKERIFRCKRRYYCIIEGCLMRVFINEINQPRIFGVANMNGADFLTEDWEETNLKLVRDYGYE